MRPLLLAVVFALCCGTASASTWTINPSGNCVTDLVAIQSTIDTAAAGDTIQLGPGVFDFSCPEASGGLGVFTPALTIAGVPGETTLQGPGAADPSEATAIFIGGDGVTVSGVTFAGFYQAVFIGVQRKKPAVVDCVFSDTLNGIYVAPRGSGARFTGNNFTLPVPPSSDLNSDFASVSAILLQRQNSYALVADNTITGPGRWAQIQSTADLAAPIYITRIGIYERDAVAPIATFNRFSNNRVSGVDSGIRVSADYAVISNNTVSNSGIGLVLASNAPDTAVIGGLVSGNTATGNQLGMWVASASGNVLSLNDFRGNSVVGLLFQNTIGGAPTDANVFVLNEGSKQGVAGNQGSATAELFRDRGGDQ